MTKSSNNQKYPQINTNTAVSLGTILVFLTGLGGIVAYIGNFQTSMTRFESRTSERIGTLESSVKELKTTTEQIGSKQNEQILKQGEQNNKIDVRLTRIEMMLQQALRGRPSAVRPQ